MDKRHLHLWILLIILFIPNVNSYSQRIDNVHPEIEGESIHVYYDLIGITPDQSVIVKVFMSTDGGNTYGEPLKSVTGDVGTVAGPGKGKCIIWDVFKDVDELVSVNVKFKVTADLLQNEQFSPPPGRTFKISLNSNGGYKTILETGFFGFNLKGVVYLDQLGLGVRGEYYRTVPPSNDYSNLYYPSSDTGNYWGYSGAAVVEYDLLRSDKYSLYPFFCLGQTKVLYTYDPGYKDEEYFKYSIFGTIGLGFDINIVKFLYLGAEIEYCLSPWLDIIPSEDIKPDEGIDGLSFGITVKFVINPG